MEINDNSGNEYLLGEQFIDDHRKGAKLDYIDLDLLTEQKKRLQVYEQKNFPVYYLGWGEEEGNSGRKGNWSLQKPDNFDLDKQRVIILHLKEVPMINQWQAVAQRQTNPKYLVIRACQ